MYSPVALLSYQRYPTSAGISRTCGTTIFIHLNKYIQYEDQCQDHRKLMCLWLCAVYGLVIFTSCFCEFAEQHPAMCYTLIFCTVIARVFMSLFNFQTASD